MWKANSDLKVILGVRDSAQVWYKSAKSTILIEIGKPEIDAVFERLIPENKNTFYDVIPVFRLHARWFVYHLEQKNCVKTSDFFQTWSEKEWCDCYDQWLEYVKSNIPVWVPNF